ncbi:hypothetical protein DQ384_36440 [Sphaerisporangium album]|uniref:Uncharacterized protein n=1 Tax=Sphaerisporangium album TaxID=509200 RepID=A0A367EVB5_9ACTN|nr:hypothetical protein [Sphaerisporangium album]RCG21951.1 hypothetical protein DQ384_36440 [Sphaerisporangium album]
MAKPYGVIQTVRVDSHGARTVRFWNVTIAAADALDRELVEHLGPPHAEGTYTAEATGMLAQAAEQIPGIAVTQDGES